MDSDKILVIQDGHAVEFDTPQKLLNNRNSVLLELVKDGGYSSISTSARKSFH